MSNPKRLEDVLNNLRQQASTSTMSNLPQINPLTGEVWTPTGGQTQQLESYADVQNRIGNASQRLSYVGENPNEILDTRNPIEKALNLPEKQNVVFDVFELLQRVSQSAFALASPPKVSEGMASYQKWARDNRDRLKKEGLLDDTPLVTGEDGKQRARELDETSAYKLYLKEGGTPISEPRVSENPTYQLEHKFNEVKEIMAGNQQLYGGELIRRWMNVTDQDKAKEDGTLDWTDFAGFYLDMVIDPGGVKIKGLKAFGIGRTLTEKGIKVVKESAQQAGLDISKTGVKKLVRSGAPGKVDDVKQFAQTVKNVSKITFEWGDTARVAKEVNLSLNRYIWSTTFDGVKQTAKVGNRMVTKMLTMADPVMAKNYTKFLGSTMDTISRGGKQLNQVVSKALNNKRKLARILSYEEAQFDKYFEGRYLTMDTNEELNKIFAQNQEKLLKFQEAQNALTDQAKLPELIKETIKREFMTNTKNYYEFMELARKGMNGYDFVDYITNDSAKVLNYSQEGELLFRSMFGDEFDDLIKIIDGENGLRLFKFDDAYFGIENKKKLYDLISERTIKIGDTHIDTFTKNQVQSINNTVKRQFNVDPKQATTSQIRSSFTAMKQPARISYLIEEARKFTKVSDFVKEYAKEIAQVLTYKNEGNLAYVNDFIEAMAKVDASDYGDVRLAVFDILSEFSEKTAVIKAEMLGIDASGLHRYLDDVKPKPPELAPIKTAQSVFEPKPKVSKVGNDVSLSKEQSKLLQLKKSNKLGKVGDELVASVEKSADSLGITKLSTEEAQTVIQKTEVNVGMNKRNGDISEMVKVSDILPFAEYNRVDNQFSSISKLAQDVKLNGFQEPIILEVNPTTGFATIGEGNHRLAVAVALGLDEIPVRTLRSKFLEPIQNKGGWFIDNTLIPYHTVNETKYFDFYEAKPSVVGLPSRPFELTSEVKTPELPTKPGLKLNKEVAKRLGEVQEFERYALKEINAFANKLLNYEINVAGVKVKLIDFLGEEDKAMIMASTDGGKRNVIQAFRQLADTNPALKGFLDEKTWTDLVGKPEFDLLTGQSILPQTSKPLFYLPPVNFYTPDDLEYYKMLGDNPLYRESAQKYGETIKKMQTHIGAEEFGDPNALVKNSIRGYSPHVMRKIEKETGKEILKDIESVDDEAFVNSLRGMFRKLGLNQDDADLFVFGRNKVLGERTYAMSAREANNVRNALLVETVQNSTIFAEKLDEDTKVEIIDYIKQGLFSEDAGDALQHMVTKKMEAINYGNKNIKILTQMAFGDVDNQYVQFVPKNEVPSNRNLKALTPANVRHVKKSLVTIAELTGQGKGDYMEKLIKTFDKAIAGKGSIHMDEHIIKQMLPNYQRNVKGYLKFIDKVNNYFKAGKTLSVMFNIRNLVGNWSNMWFSGMGADDIMKGYTSSVADYNKFKKFMTEIKNSNFTLNEKMLQGEQKKIYDEIMYFMDNGFFTGNTALELADVRKLIEEGADKKTLARKLGEVTGLIKLSEFNMNTNLFNDNVNRLTLFRHAKKNPKFLKSLGIPLTGDVDKDAMNAVRLVLFDPNDLSFFEQDIMKRLIPFYTFQRQNLAFQVQNFTKNTDRYNKMWRAWEGAWDSQGIETDQLMDYERDRMILPVPFMGKDGNYTAIRIAIPFVDALEFFNLGDPQESIRKVVSSTTPLVRAPYEQLTNTSVFTGEPIERYKDEQSKNFPFLTKGQEWALGQTGVDVPARALTQGVISLGNLATGDTEALGQSVSKATGLYQPERSIIQNEIAKGYEKLEQLEDLIKKVKETKDVPTLSDIKKLSTGGKYDSLIEQQRKLNDLINGLKR